MKQRSFIKISFLIISVISNTESTLGNVESSNNIEHTCSTPNEWLILAGGVEQREVTNRTDLIFGGKAAAAINTLQGKKWPGGIVKYRLHYSLTQADIREVRAAFDEYHQKTCIRFEAWRKGDPPDYTSIEMDNSVCGIAHVCKVGGYQYAKFGKICRNKATIIHELGHNLCLGHEHQRSDRDNYISFDQCEKGEQPPAKLAYQVTGMYDYTSQMHYACSWCFGGWPKEQLVKKCGSQVTEGLSVLDADYINDLYNCQGCHRHRWRPIDRLSPEDESNLYDFGYMDIQGESLYPCRAMIRGELSIGKFSRHSGVCRVPYKGKEYYFRNGARSEVLTIPGGISLPDSRYTLINPSINIPIESLVGIAVPGGRLISSDSTNSVTTSYIAFGMLQSPLHKRSEDVIGKVWLVNGRFGNSYFPLGTKEVTEEMNFRILVCYEY